MEEEILFHTRTLRRVVRDLRTPAAFLLDTFFAEVDESTSETIEFHIEKGGRKMAPFVSPRVAGPVVNQLGYESNTLSPAYIKDKREFQPNRGLRRRIGERIGGELSPEERIRMAINENMQDQIERLTRRLEWMAAKAMVEGQYTIAGENYPERVVDFRRDSSLTVALSGGDRWGEGGKPLNHLEDWAELVEDASGAPVTDVVMDIKAWRRFHNDEDVRKLLDIRRGDNSDLRLSPEYATVQFKGTIGAFGIWVYNEKYEDDSGSLHKMIPDNTIVMGGPAVEGVRHFGAIQDHDAGMEPMMWFPKSWLENDPSVRWLLMQSAPLVVPYRPDNTLAATVYAEE